MSCLCMNFDPIKLGSIENDQERSELMKGYVESLRSFKNESKQQSIKKKFCPICNSLVDSPNMYVVGNCCHRCMKTHVEKGINLNNGYVQCPCDQCGLVLDNAELLYQNNIINLDLKLKYEKKLLEVYLNKNELIRCPLCKINRIKNPGETKIFCKHCNKHFCFNCLTEWHDGFTCQQYANYLRMSPLLKELYNDGIKFINGNKDGQMKNCIVQFNSLILNNCLSYQRFINSLQHVPCAHSSDGFFAWHGSSEDGVRGICQDGFDPKRRAGQACGPGEYFGTTPAVSAGYLKNGSNHMILTFIIRSKVCTNHGSCYVVNNPTNWEYSYCLPLFIISYKAHAPVNYVDSKIPLNLK